MTSQEKTKLTEQIDAAIKRRRRIVYRLAKGLKNPSSCPYVSRYIVEGKTLRLAKRTGLGTGKRIQAMAERSAADWEKAKDEQAKENLMHSTFALFAVAEAIRGNKRHLRDLATTPKMR